jgi:hypothetical protein
MLVATVHEFRVGCVAVNSGGCAASASRRARSASARSRVMRSPSSPVSNIKLKVASVKPNSHCGMGRRRLVRFMASGGLKVGGKIGAILGARVGGMDAERVERAARMLPDAAPLVPVEAQSPKQAGQIGFPRWRDIQPNPLADNLGDFVLPRQPRPQIVQNTYGGQAAILAMPDKVLLPFCPF